MPNPSVTVAASAGCLYGDPYTGDPAAVVPPGTGVDVVLPLVDAGGRPLTLDADATLPTGRGRVLEAALMKTGMAAETTALTADRAGLTLTLADGVPPGVYKVEGQLLDANGKPRAFGRGIVYAAAGPFDQPVGIPGVDDVRAAVRDYPAARRLLGGYEFTAAEIAKAVVRAVQRFNATPPAVAVFATTSWFVEWRSPLLDGTLAELFEVAGAYYRADALPYSAGGVSVDDTAKQRDYDRAADTFRKRWARWCDITQASVNIAGGFGTSPSAYDAAGTGWNLGWRNF